ncbi:RodZ domain-containing protein [Paenisporosarcina sp. TG20]|uniref:helix-turn-helix domain-containing protein n=1 Tax=Paenisporosarcina sp. TG20 TaxID=1211706 RepID=UPI00031F32D3|nr:RodZ domain-containing protein [Paenisporosarcina sp. TG20]
MSELGTRLKEARMSKGYSLDDLQEITKIQKRYLAGIEEGNYSMMPGQFYVRAFIKQYADAVGLNSDELLESYKNDVPSSTSEEMHQKMTSVPSRRRVITKSSKNLNEFFPMIIVALFIIIGIVIFWYIFQNLAETPQSEEPETEEKMSLEEKNNTPSKDDIAEEEPIEEPIVEPEPVQMIEVGTIEGETTNYSLSGTDTFSLTLVALGRSWVEVKDQSGVVSLARELATGETVTFDLSDTESVRVRVGAAPQINVLINDEKVEYGIPTTERVTQNMMIQFLKQ